AAGRQSRGGFTTGSSYRNVRQESWSFPEDRRVVAAQNLKDHRLVRALAAEILLQALAKHGNMDANDVVAAGIVIRRATKDFVSDLLLMDLFGKAFEHAVAKIDQQIAKPDRM